MKNIGINSNLAIPNGLIRNLQSSFETITKSGLKNIGTINSRVQNYINQQSIVLKPKVQSAENRQPVIVKNGKLPRDLSGSLLLNQSAVNLPSTQFKNNLNLATENTTINQRGSNLSDLKYLETLSTRQEEKYHISEVVKNLSDPLITTDSSSITLNQKLSSELVNSNNSKSSSRYLNLWQDHELQHLDLKYQSKNRGEQAFVLELDNQGNLTLQINDCSDSNWWNTQKQYLQSALSQLGYQSFRLQTVTTQK